MSKLKRRIMVFFITLGIIVAVLFGVGYLILHSPSFGALPSGARLERILHSPNYRDGRFQNRLPHAPSHADQLYGRPHQDPLEVPLRPPR